MMKMFIAKIFKKNKKCLCNKNTFARKYFSDDNTPMIEFMCFDCGYRDSGHVYADPSNWKIESITLKNGKIIDPFK